ncbi:MAG: GNAT family N-acetyltransferase [Ruminiclostridium sp.]|nr:GNAT family N-acetyltransferase [Ruminiclostridium sp.]
MTIRPGTIDEMLSLWYKFYTTEFFVENLQSGNAEFWTVEDQGRLVGELYLFKHLSDHDFADGFTTAYLYGFYVAEDMRGKGLGTLLLKTVLERLSELSFRYATIGVEPHEKANVRLYERMGFTEKIKTCHINLCDVDKNYRPTHYPRYRLLRKTL